MPRRLSRLVDAVTRLYPLLEDADRAIRSGRVLVDGRPVLNPASVVGPGSSVVVVEPEPLRGEAKLRAAIEAFRVRVEGRVALDVGAAAGGFTRTLLACGARRVYAVDAGHGQLIGSLRQEARVVNLESTNLGSLDGSLVPDTIDVFTLDLSYLSLAAAVPQLERIAIARDADLVALVKPMFELHLAQPPAEPTRQREALERAVDGIQRAGWRVVASMESPVRGARGAVEFLAHAVKDGG